jgi:rare lipoprotein A
MRRPAGILFVLTALLLSACGGGAGVKPEPRRPAPIAPGDNEPRSKYGNPESYEVFGETYRVLATARGYRERGMASWYGEEFHGKRTSSGEPYNMHAMTAAHRTLPLPSYVRVTNLRNKREVIVRVNDRGPFHDDRLIDLSFAAASELGILKNGTAEVEVAAVDPVLAASENDRANRLVSSVSSASPAPPPPAAHAAAAPAEPASDVLAPDEIPASARPPDESGTIVGELPADETLTLSPPPPPAAVPVALHSAPATAAGHYLQAGAFSLAKNAHSLVDRLRGAGFGNVDVYPAGGILKVRLGPYSDLAALQSDRDRLAGLGVRAWPVEE